VLGLIRALTYVRPPYLVADSISDALIRGDQMKVYIGADHRGYDFKKKIIKILNDQKHNVVDVGTHLLIKWQARWLNYEMDVGFWFACPVLARR